MSGNFSVAERNPGRFVGDFTIEPAPDHTPTPAEVGYIAAVTRIQAGLAADADAAHFSAPTTSARALAMARVRRAAASKLRAETEAFLGRRQGIAAASAAVAMAPAAPIARAEAIEHAYQAEIGNISSSPFVLEEVMRTDQASGQQLVVDLAIDVAPADADRQLSKEQLALFVAISSTATVLDKACSNLAPVGWVARLLEFLQPRSQVESWETLRDVYMRKLARIARFGLQGAQHDLAIQALEGFRNEFVVQQAGRIKNAYILRLMFAAGIFAAIFLAGYGIHLWKFSSDPGRSPVAFILAAFGASVGTWLSFSIRNVALSFSNLANLEDDLLKPTYRVVFVVALTMSVCLLFSTGAMNIEIGSLKTNVFRAATSAGSSVALPTPVVAAASNVAGPATSAPARVGIDTSAAASVELIAILIGLLCGMSERGLARAVSGRADTFVKGIGGAG